MALLLNLSKSIIEEYPDLQMTSLALDKAADKASELRWFSNWIVGVFAGCAALFGNPLTTKNSSLIVLICSSIFSSSRLRCGSGPDKRTRILSWLVLCFGVKRESGPMNVRWQGTRDKGRGG